MTQPLPKALKKCPLQEAYFELRFTPTKPAAGDLLPGLLYATLQKDYSEVLPLPLANVPRQFREKNPELLYQASHRLSSGVHSVHVGDRMVNLHTLEYPGWTRFKERIASLLEELQKTEFVKQIERFSFKYVNLIEASETESQLQFLDMRIEMMGKLPLEAGFHLRTEHKEEKFTTVIQIGPHTTATTLPTKKEISGLMVDVDTIRLGVGNEFWTDRDSLLEEGHMVVKRMFFSLLTKPALERMEPEW